MYLGRPAVWHYGLVAVRQPAFLVQVMRVSRHHRRGWMMAFAPLTYHQNSGVC
jgi:hypothetical protein